MKAKNAILLEFDEHGNIAKEKEIAVDLIEEGDILIVIGPSGIESLLKKTFISS